MNNSDSEIPWPARVKMALYDLGMDTSNSAVEQMIVLLAAQQIFNERNARYRDQWREFGWKGTLHDMRKKMTRIWQEFWNAPRPNEHVMSTSDDALDLINYTAFFIRDLADGNMYGPSEMPNDPAR